MKNFYNKFYLKIINIYNDCNHMLDEKIGIRNKKGDWKSSYLFFIRTIV